MQDVVGSYLASAAVAPVKSAIHPRGYYEGAPFSLDCGKELGIFPTPNKVAPRDAHKSKFMGSALYFAEHTAEGV